MTPDRAHSPSLPGQKGLYKIALVNNADPENRAHWKTASSRKSRAIRECRKMREEGNRYAMLFHFVSEGRFPVRVQRDRAND